MKYNQLSVEQIQDVMEDICDEYGSFIDETCKEEAIEKFFDKWYNVSLSGMTKTEADEFVELLGFFFDKQMVKLLNEE
jgi:hypothetical protein